MNTLTRISAALLALMIIFALTFTAAVFADPEEGSVPDDVTNESSGDTPSVDTPSGDTSSSDTPSGDNSSGDTSSEESRPTGGITVTLNSVGQGEASLSSGSQSGNTVTVNAGDEVTVNIICDTDNSISLLTVGGSALSEAAGKAVFTYSFAPDADTEVSVTIAPDTSVGRDITVGNCGMCSVSLSTTRANVGATVTVTVTPDIPEVQRLVAVTVNGKYITFTGNTATFTVGEDAKCEVAATCMSLYPLMLEDCAHGSISAYPNNDNLSYVTGSRVTLTFTPDDGYVLSSVTVTVDGEAPQDMTGSVSGGKLTITTRDRQTTVSAVYTKGVKVNVSITGNGSYTPNQQYFEAGKEVTFNFIPDEGYTFKSLTVNGESVNAPNGKYTCTVEEEMDMAVEFVRAVKLTPNITAGGKVYINGTEMTGVMYVSTGSDLNIRIAPSANYEFKTLNINGSPVNLNGSLTYTLQSVTADTRIAVKFAVSGNVKTIKLNVVAGAHGTVTPNGESEIAEGDTVEFEFTPDAGYIINTVTVNGSKVSVTNNKLTLKDIREDTTVNVSFREGAEGGMITADDVNWNETEITIDISQKNLIAAEVFARITQSPSKRVVLRGPSFSFTLPAGSIKEIGDEYASVFVTLNDSSASEYGALSAMIPSSRFFLISVDGSMQFPTGTRFTLDFGQQFAGKPVNYLIFDGQMLSTPVDNNGAAALNVTDVGQTGSVSVDYYGNSSFVICEKLGDSVTITASASANGYITPTGKCDVVFGTDAVFNITAYEGYVIDKLLVDGKEQSDANGQRTFSYSFKKVTSEHTITVTFVSTDSTQSPDDDNSGLLVSLIIVFVSIAAAGVLLIIRWRQENY